jgi:hypothetical protein
MCVSIVPIGRPHFGSLSNSMPPLRGLNKFRIDCYKHAAPNGASETEPTTRMANTYTQLYVQIVFAVEGRQNLISPDRKEELHRYITGIVTRNRQKLIAIHCMPDHSHILVGLKQACASPISSAT